MEKYNITIRALMGSGILREMMYILKKGFFLIIFFFFQKEGLFCDFIWLN